jgi:autonomous glycyl radical cofactor GrcA
MIEINVGMFSSDERVDLGHCIHVTTVYRNTLHMSSNFVVKYETQAMEHVCTYHFQFNSITDGDKY